MFIISVSASWLYNSYLSSFEKEEIQTDILFEVLGNPKMLRFRAGTRTTMAVLVCSLLFHGVECSSPKDARILRRRLLHEFLPNETTVWKRWKDKVVEQLMGPTHCLTWWKTWMTARFQTKSSWVRCLTMRVRREGISMFVINYLLIPVTEKRLNDNRLFRLAFKSRHVFMYYILVTSDTNILVPTPQELRSVS